VGSRGDLTQEPAPLLFAAVMNALQRSEGKLQHLAAAERRGHFIENAIKNANRLPGITLQLEPAQHRTKIHLDPMKESRDKWRILESLLEVIL
jgi:hypothetical protein